MAIYRGEGGAGDATADASNAAAIADSFADAANASAGQAAASAASALAAKVAAELAETNAETAETNAEAAEAAAEAVLTDAGFIVVAADLQGTDTIGTVATNIANVNATGNNIASVNTVAGISADVTAVAGDATDIGIVATNIANVNATGSNIANVNAVGADLLEPTSEINTVAVDIANVNTVGTNIANVNTVAGISANVTSVAGNSTNINTVATNIANVNSVGGNIANVNSVAGNATNINTVAGISANVTTVAGISGNVTTVATNNASVTTVAGSIANVNTNATNIANINQNAANIVAIQGASANATAAAASATAAAGSATSASASAAAASAVALGNEPVRHSVRPSLLLDFANTKTLDPRITFTRASTATFYDGKTVAKAEENLVTLSQELDNAAWIKLNATVTANSTTAPDGTTTAETITDDTTSGQHSVRSTTGTGNIAIPASTQAVASIFLKAGTNNFACFALTDSGTGRYATVVVDLSTGTITQTDVLLNTLNSSSITAVGNGWYRVVLVATAGASGFNNVRVALAPAGTGNTFLSGAASYVGTGTTIFAWGAQVEARSSVTAYTATTTAAITNYIPALQTAASGVARFEHNPVTGESLGLEIEEQRTNLLTYSEFQTGVSGVGLVTASTMFGADGTNQIAAAFSRDGATTSYLYKGTVLASTVYTLSVYVKMDDGLAPSFGSASATNVANDFVLIAGNSVAPLSQIVTHVGNGLYRVSVTLTTTAGGLANNGVIKYGANSTRTFKTTGWQIEAGAFATSYIPTVASQVTRSADSASMTGTNFSSWYRADEGTVYTEMASAAPATTSQVVAISDNSISNRIVQSSSSTNALLVSVGGTAQASLTTAVVSANTFSKLATVYKVNDFAVSRDGATALTDTLGQVPVVDRMFIGNGSTGTGAALSGTMKKLAFYPRRLTNAELQSLTVI